MKYYVGMSQIMNDKESSLNHMEELLEEIMREEKLRRRSYESGYGGELYIRIQSIIASHVMSFKE